MSSASSRDELVCVCLQKDCRELMMPQIGEWWRENSKNGAEARDLILVRNLPYKETNEPSCHELLAPPLAFLLISFNNSLRAGAAASSNRIPTCPGHFHPRPPLLHSPIPHRVHPASPFPTLLLILLLLHLRLRLLRLPRRHVPINPRLLTLPSAAGTPASASPAACTPPAPRALDTAAGMEGRGSGMRRIDAWRIVNRTRERTHGG